MRLGHAACGRQQKYSSISSALDIICEPMEVKIRESLCVRTGFGGGHALVFCKTLRARLHDTRTHTCPSPGHSVRRTVESHGSLAAIRSF